MFKFIFLLFLFTYVNCESELDYVTTTFPLYSANQVDDDSNSNSVEIKIQDRVSNEIIQPISTNEIPATLIDEIIVPQVENRVEHLTEAKEVKQVHIEELADKSEPNAITENVDNEPVTTITEAEVTTIEPEVNRIKRNGFYKSQYTVGQILAPNGIGHEIGHLRDHAVDKFGRMVVRNSLLPSLTSKASRYAAIGKARTEIHHKYHHMPNHLAYLPVIGPLLDEKNPNRIKLDPKALLRIKRSPLRRRFGLGSIFRRGRRIGRRLRRIIF